MKRATLARLIGAAALALHAVVAGAPGDADACGSAVYLARPIRRAVAATPDVKPPPDPPKPVDIVPPFPAPRTAPIVPPFPAPRAKPHVVPPPPQVDRPLLVADAEQALSEGRHARAAALVTAAFPALRKVSPGSLVLADRALRVLALASVRSDGRVEVNGMTGKTAVDRSANLVWSADVLGSLNARRANNPSYQTDLGEALAKVPERKADAAKLLGELADRDLVTSAEGYAALARLRAEQGDDSTRAELRRRCELMTKTPAICAAPDQAGRS